MLGDSVSRNLIDDGCSHLGGVIETWGDSLLYSSAGKKWIHAGATCRSTNLLISSVNLFGSKKNGRYHNGFQNNQADPFVDTERRIPESIKQFSAKFGMPQYVSYRADLWDLHAIPSENVRLESQRNVYLQEYILNLFWAFDLIRELLPKATLISHTIPRTQAQWASLHGDYMNSLRYVAEFKGIVLFDWYQFLENSPPASYLRDQYHPDASHSINFMKVLTRALTAWSCVNMTISRTDLARTILSKAGGHTYYLVDEQGLRHLIEVNSTFPSLPSYFASSPRIVLIGSEIEKITLSSVSFRFLAEGSLVRNEHEKTVYLVKDGKKHPIQDGRAFLAHGWSFDEVLVLPSQFIDFIAVGDKVG